MINMMMAPPINIRPMKPDDMAACRIIAGECWSKFTGQVAEPEFREAFAPAGWRPTYYVAEMDDTVVGMAGYGTSWLSYGIYNLFWVAVRPKWQKRGIGNALVDRCIADLEPIADAIMLVTGVPSFYERGWGFQRLGELPQSEGFGTTLMIRRYGDAPQAKPIDLIPRQAALDEITRLTSKWGKPAGTPYEEAVQDHGNRLLGAINALPSAE